MKKHPLISILVAIVLLLLLAVLIVPLFINANTFRGTLETQLSSALGRKVTLGNLSFSLFSGSLVADNVSIADDPAFSTKPFLQAQSLHIGVEVGPLLLHRQLLVTSFVADSPPSTWFTTPRVCGTSPTLAVPPPVTRKTRKKKPPCPTSPWVR